MAIARKSSRAFHVTDVAAAATTIAANRRPAFRAIEEIASQTATARSHAPTYAGR
jgi:hypothetical protein